MAAPIERNERLHILLSDEESTMLKALAAHRGLTASDLLRTLVRENWLRCGWCGVEARLRERKPGSKPNTWRMKNDLRVCPECAPSVLR